MMKISKFPVCLSLFCFGVVFATVPRSERQALADFYTSTQGQSWVGKRNWMTGDPCENNWGGVFCNQDLTNVQVLLRQQQNLNGTIPDSIGDLTQLQQLTLSFNPYLVGTLPPFYVGSETLESLTLQSNGLTGPLPPKLGQTPNLGVLYLSGNFAGTIPDDLFGAPLEQLSLLGSQLEGTLPDSFCKSPPLLTTLYLAETQLSGTFPDCLDNFPQLTYFTVTQNSFSGTIPSTLSKLPGLYQLEMFDNQLTGSLPDQLATTNLKFFAFGQNEFVGTIPDYSNNFANISASDVYVANNQLTGTIPDWVCELQVLQAKNNQFQCPEPSCCGDGYHNCGNCQ